MNLKVASVVAAACSMVSLAIAEGPELSFSGFLDADGWADMKGQYYTNTELDLGLSIKFSDAVSAHVYATANGVYSTSAIGNVPAGLGIPSERWLTFNFDGFDITYNSPLGTFTVGDIVYQYGKFNYYIYKRFSMITNERFSRGIKYGVGGDKFFQEVQIGIADNDSYTGDVVGTTSLTLSETQSVGVFYGIRGNSKVEFIKGSNFFAGTEYKGGFGDAFKLKFDVGYNRIGGDTAYSLTTILVEPTLTLGKFTTAATAFFGIDDKDSMNVVSKFFKVNDNIKISDEMFFYVEPGYTFTDVFAVGLPLEFHDPNMDIEKDEAFWLVPTFYIYPIANVQWWLWGQVVLPTAEDTDPGYGLGSEIIVTF